jgi:predicted DCC family thiol-disulfide oxidoreductase YuxK
MGTSHWGKPNDITENTGQHPTRKLRKAGPAAKIVPPIVGALGHRASFSASLRWGRLAARVDFFVKVFPDKAMNPGSERQPGRHLILYDGVCGLCNRLTAFVLPRDPTGVFHFAPLQSELSRSILLRYGRNPDVLDTFYVVADYRSSAARLWSKARAALFVGRQIGGIWKLATVIGILPNFMLNAVYDLIARHRYRIFGRYDTCLMPKSEYKTRFVGL